MLIQINSLAMFYLTECYMIGCTHLNSAAIAAAMNDEELARAHAAIIEL